MVPYFILSLLLFLFKIPIDASAFFIICSSWQKDAIVLMFVVDLEARVTSSLYATVESPENPLADLD